MKRVCITYKMFKLGEIAETCIVLPMEDHTADAAIDKIDNFIIPLHVYQILCSLSRLQGYHYAGFCSAEEVQEAGDNDD